MRNLGALLAIPQKTKPEIALLPSYDHWSLVLNLAVRLAGGRVVMMNETHGGTARASGLKAAIKRKVVASFHAGFVGGAPHVRYFASLGLPEHKIFTGYDAVDNDYFAGKAREARKYEPELRKRYGLPQHYFLGLGRFVAKKNFSTLIRAYRKFLDARPDCATHLVMVGSGEEDRLLRALCHELRLPIHDKTSAGKTNQTSKMETEPPGVHFYGFRQIEENPIFYGLADAFILPSLREEWGLVVNEAMASGLPVVVSETAGCAEDLLKPGWPALPNMLMTHLPVQWAQFSSRIRRNGFVFNPRSPEALASTLQALASAPALRAVMGQASRTIIEDSSCEVFARNALLAAQAAHGKNLLSQPAPLPVENSLAAAPTLTQ